MLQAQGHREFSFIDRAREFLFVSLPFAVIFSVAGIAHYFSVYQTERITSETRELLNVSLARSVLNNELAAVITDLTFLSDYFKTQGFDQAGIIKKKDVTGLLLGFSAKKQLYDQIRFLNPDGNEVVRVNLKDGESKAVPESLLQNKADRYYFRESIGLDNNELYISPLDLNMEQGEIEMPYKPVMRFATPVYSRDGTKRGILVLNYLGKRVLGSFIRATANIADHVHLLNANGYWLHSPQTNDAWGFMLPHKRRFSAEYPRAWKDMSNNSGAGQFRTESGLFSFETVTPLAVASQAASSVGLSTETSRKGAGRWVIASRVAPQDDAPTPWVFVTRNLPLYLLMLIVLVVGSWLLASTRLRHRRAELESEYERRFRHTLEKMKLAAVSVDKKARLRFCNHSFLQLTGWEPEDVLNGDWVSRFIAPEHQEATRQAFNSLEQGQEFPKQVEDEVVTRLGDRRLISWHNTSFYDSTGQIAGITAIGEDITERKLAEARVRELSQAVEQSPSIVMLTDKNGRIEYVNPKFTDVTGYTPEEVQGRNPSILKSGEISPEGYQSLWEKVLQGEEWRGEFHNRRKNGELYWESASISALRGEDGEITNYVAVKEDITERKRMEAEIEEHHKEMARHQALAAMGRMAGMIAHDLRNPLSSVKMGMQILGRQTDAERRELAEIGMGQILYMENILSDMLAYARPEAVKSDWIDMRKLLESIMSGMQGRLDEADVVPVIKVEAGLPTVPADPDKLRRLFSNLVSNALQSLEEKGGDQRRLEIDATINLNDSGTSVKVVICDNGKGLEGVDTEKLFEPFFTTRAQGTGLGLAIVRQIVDQHRGTIDLSQRGNGDTCATVVLPTVPADTPTK
ncbi:MAG: PAS domain S-box protein [Candidatus Sedimenticola sp. 4PFRAG1]